MEAPSRIRWVRSAGAAVVAAALALGPAPAPAYELDDTFELFGHVQLWMTAYEQAEEHEGLYQSITQDPAATWTSGFSLARARLGTRLHLLDGLLTWATQLRLEDNPGLLDLYLDLAIAPWLSLRVGQQKIPGPRVTLCASRDLEFIFRPQIAEAIADYSLSRTRHISSLFYGVHAYLRDLGVSLRGDVDLGVGELRWMAMVGNGLGSNLFIGNANEEFILTNAGQFYYGGRVELAELGGWLTVGGHASYNQHDDMAFNSGRVVIDLVRFSGSGDARLAVPGTGLVVEALAGGGEVLDDYDDDGNVDLRYFGWSGGLVWSLAPLVTSRWPGFDGHDLRIAGRYDYFESEWNDSGQRPAEHRWSVGIAYGYGRWIEVMVNYVSRLTVDPSVPELGDDILLIQVEAGI